jgi:hypothetical protein
MLSGVSWWLIPVGSLPRLGKGELRIKMRCESAHPSLNNNFIYRVGDFTQAFDLLIASHLEALWLLSRRDVK